MIKRHIVVVVLYCTLALGAFALQAVDEWVPFAPPDNSFTAIFPVKPDAPQHIVESVTIGKKEEGGAQKDIKADVVADFWVTKVSFGVYEVGVTDYPIEINIAQELDADRDNFLKEVNAKLISESETTQKGFAGREFTGTNTTYTFKCRVFADHRRAYLAAAVEPTTSFSASRADRFLKAFVITSKPR